jgi:hypothetical protein
MKRHWRYLVARWGCWPVVWCLAGEATMPYYLSETKDLDRSELKKGWTELAAYLRAIDPYGRVVTIHPTQIGRDQVEDDGLLDVDMLQTGHGGASSVPNTVSRVVKEVGRAPAMPVIDGEVNYEGILHGTQAEIQRLGFWACLLSGAAGHTYGANGIWQLNGTGRAFGPSPHGANWGRTPWTEAMDLLGSAHLGFGKRLLDRYAWWRFEPHPEWTNRPAGPANYFMTYAAGIPGEVRVIYHYTPVFPYQGEKGRLRILDIEPDVPYRAFVFDPRSGEEHDLGAVKPNADRQWVVPLEPELTDWVLVMEAAGA